MELFLSLCIGIGLSAACGFRIFVPLLVMSIAAKSGHLTLVANFQWIGSDIALITFAVATCLEIAAYYIPWLDHALDVMATPAAIIAGTIVTASMVGGMSPFLKWTLAVIAGGGAAGLVQGATVVTRGASGAGTGGMGNPIVATLELAGSVITSILSIIAPIAAVILLVVGFVFVGKKISSKIFRRKKILNPESEGRAPQVPVIPKKNETGGMRLSENRSAKEGAEIELEDLAGKL